MKQREIKFRAWDKESKSMLTGFTFLSQDIIAPPYWRKTLGEVEWMQFTGLLDKNGKEIYEGDIVKAGISIVREVIFNKGVFCYQNDIHEFHIFDEKEVEVIGNIYEDSDLLKN